jgi:hypothetical protein
MATCKDGCLYKTLCKYNDGTNEWSKSNCPLFKNKADFVKVVRCKDCKHCEHINDEFARDYYQCKIRGNFFYRKSDDFCSYGELKECEGK